MIGCRIPAALLLVALAGCVAPPEVALVPEPVLVVEREPESIRDRRAETRWWRQFDDPVLESLIEQGLADNPGPQIAMARLQQARSGLRIAQAGRWPMIEASGNRAEQRFNGPEPNTRTERSALRLQWDPGLWGRRELEVERAEQGALGFWFDHEQVVLTLSAAIADTYFRIVELGMQASLLDAQVQVSEDLERLIEERFRLGQSPASAVYQQRAQTAVLRQLAIVTATQKADAETSLDVLLGAVPDARERVSRASFPVLPEATSMGHPQELIRHRADLRAGYARLKQAAADVGIRIVDRLPSLQVTADLTSMTNEALSSGWVGYGLDLAMPLFTAGALRGLEEQARHALEEERQRYLQTWLAALEEVQTAQRQRARQRAIIEEVSSRRDHARQALEAARNRYQLGDQNYLDVLTALRVVQEADRSLVAEQRQFVTLTIRSAVAIGQPNCEDDVECMDAWAI